MATFCPPRQKPVSNYSSPPIRTCDINRISPREASRFLFFRRRIGRRFNFTPRKSEPPLTLYRPVPTESYRGNERSAVKRNCPARRAGQWLPQGGAFLGSLN